MTEIAQRELAVNLVTGVAIDVADASTEDLGRFLDESRDFKRRMQEQENIATREVLRRQDREAKWTTPAGSYVLKGSSPAAAHVEEFDELALRTDLLDLVDAGELSIEAVDAAVEIVITYRARKAGINALRRLGGEVAAIVNRHATHSEKNRYIKVERVK